MLSWAGRRHGGRYLVVWCQVSQRGWDDYAGSEFVVEFQLSIEPIVGASSDRRQRFGAMLDGVGREEIRQMQNHVIASLTCPPAQHPLLQISQLREWYLGRFRRIEQPYSGGEDIWLRYASKEHVVNWARFILRKLPACFENVASWED